MIIIKILLFIYFFVDINSSESGNNLSIKIIETSYSSNYAFPINNKDNNLYILTGDISGTNRNITKFNSKGILIDNNYFSSENKFENPEAIYVENDNKQFILIITSSLLELYDISQNKVIKSFSNDLFGFKASIIKLFDNNYIYSYQNEIDKEFIIKNILFKKDIKDEIIEISEKEEYKISSKGSIISCDKTIDDNKYIICIYLNEKNELEISSFSSNLELLTKKVIDSSNSFQSSNFFKIVYFKDSNKFIVMNSLNEDYSRLRYIKYMNKLFLNQLGFISEDYNDFIDVEQTELSPHYKYNDIISINSSRIIKISSYENNIIISNYEFKSDDKLLIIKTFKINNNAYGSFINPRLSIFNNIIVVGLSTSYLNNENKAGYIFIGNPLPLNKIITDNNEIKVKDLVYIENNIFTFDSYIKIKEIPPGFIFVNSINETIKNGDHLNINDKLIFKEYKSLNQYELKYEVISLKGDNSFTNYSSMRIYPSESQDKIIDEDSNIIINGENSVIILKLKECNNGFLPIEVEENNSDLCTKIKPEGYYLDRKEKKYKKCFNSCQSCYGEPDDISMKCEKCKDGYNITEDSDSCYNYVPKNYYLDNNIFRRCSENCSKCVSYTNTSCIECIENFTLFLSNNSCVPITEFNYESLTHSNSQFRWAFILIFIISNVIGVIVVFRPLNKKKKEIEINEKKDNIQETPLLVKDK